MIEVKLSCSGATLGCVETGFTKATAGRHLSDPYAGVENAAVCHVGEIGANLSKDFLEDMRGNPDKGVVLLEGKARSGELTTATLKAELLYDSDCVLSASMPIIVAPIEKFYRWYNNRAICGGAVSHTTNASMPPAFPDGKSDGNNVVFIHGFNVNETEARGWSAEMFKRLWQSGCNSKFHAVAWCGDEGWPNGLHYHDDVENAFATASAFASQFSSLSGETTVIAHSLGNMVVCSAIQDHGFCPDRYFMLNAAVPAEAFDATQWNTDETDNPFEFEDWVGYPSNSWASCWHSLFPTNDIRSRLTWKCRFADVPQLTSLYNYYSTGDEVLSIYDMPDSDGSGKITIHPFGLGGATYHSWQKQERFKGRWEQSALGGFGGTSEMGWGFEVFGHWTNGTPPMYELGDPALPYVTPVRMHAYTIQQALAATANQLRADPVFNHEPSEILSGNLLSADIDVLLARGVPALSGPVGSLSTGAVSLSRNENLNGRTGGSSWPRNSASEWSGWRHSDIKAIALPFVFGIFSDIRGAMEDSQ